MSVALWVRGCHPSLGKPKGSSSLAPLGREEARLVVPQGTSVLLMGSPALTRLSVPIASGMGLGRGRSTMSVGFLPPFSQSHPSYKIHMPTFPGDQAQSISHSLCRSCHSSHQDRGAGRRHWTRWQCRRSHRAESSAGCRCRSSHCKETRGSTPLEAHSLSQGREPRVSEHSPQRALAQISKRHSFLRRMQPVPGPLA